ncbi:MAG: guanylate kinase [Gemmatimonadetes bacterium]|nr:guanylate kinase [Gemmatimonadota bacterium]
MSRAAPLVLAATSGTGKTTLARRLVSDSSRFVFSVSATTRPPRAGERDGIDYHFLTREQFEARVEMGHFAEWAEVHGCLYGTPRAEIETAAARGEHVVLDIDVQGARQLRESVPDAKLVFVLPPSVGIMMTRLTGRGTEAPADIARRLNSALVELQAVPDFDYVVVNDDVDDCVKAIRAIVEGRDVGQRDENRDVDGLRREIARLLAEEYADYMHDTP